MIPDFEQELVPPALREKGWRYIDPPTKFSPEMWDKFLALMGEGEFELLAYSSGVEHDGYTWKRGQIVISPQGMLNLRDKERFNRIFNPPETPDA